MTRDANPDEPNGPQVLAQFLQDWTSLWREELQAQAGDRSGPAGARLAGAFAAIPGAGLSPDISAAMQLWQSAISAWAETLGAPPTSRAGSRDGSPPPGTTAAAAASDPRDAEVERLRRRVDELEARLAKLEAPRRRRS